MRILLILNFFDLHKNTDLDPFSIKPNHEVRGLWLTMFLRIMIGIIWKSVKITYGLQERKGIFPRFSAVEEGKLFFWNMCDLQNNWAGIKQGSPVLALEFCSRFG